jgi:hypothetical protein
VSVPWARPGSGFTLLFEALVLRFAGAMPMVKVAAMTVGMTPGSGGWWSTTCSLPATSWMARACAGWGWMRPRHARGRRHQHLR